MAETETLPDGTTAVRVELPDFRRSQPQIYYDSWRGTDRVLRYTGKCVVCRTRCYSHDDGQDDPRGILGDHSDSTMEASEYDMVGEPVAACFACMNDEHRYEVAENRAKRRWKPKPEIVPVDLSEYAVAPEAFWEEARCVGDGYDRSEVARGQGWRPVAAWGRDGWDLLEWPYYMAFFRETPDGFEFATNCEGDVDVYRFASAEERVQAVDRLAFWHWQIKGREWVRDIYADDVPDHLKGPYSPDRTA